MIGAGSPAARLVRGVVWQTTRSPFAPGLAATARVRDTPDVQKWRYPEVKVFVEPASGERPDDDGGRDRVKRVEVDGVPWPVIAIDWHAENSAGGAAISLKVRGRLRIIEESAEGDG